jgi:pyruvate kinase
MATLSRNLKLKVDVFGERAQKVRLTHIVCTIGPKTKSVEMISKLLDTGMNVVRLNFSHGTYEYHSEVIENTRTAIKQRGPDARCAIMLDTKGPEIRTGKLKKFTVKLVAGQEVEVTTDTSIIGDDGLIVLDYQDLVHSAKVGNKILIADGQISLTIKAIHEEKRSVTCVVNNTFVLGENKNVHLPGSVVNLPALSEKDKSDLIFGVEKGVDLIAASFIRTANDIKEIRETLGERGKHIKVIAKIESTEGLANFDEILAEADGIMVARGDLGVEVPMEQVFIAQKMMVSKCNAAGKPVITATQMLESMIQNPRPTRAEATDVANAVLDGTDCVMLSGETASGDFPLEAVSYMSGMCKEAERVEAATDHANLFEALREESKNHTHSLVPSVPEVVCSYAVRASIDLEADLIITLTETGTTSRLVSKYKPRVPIVCITHNDHVANFLLLTKAAIPYVVPTSVSADDLVKAAMEKAKHLGLCKSGSLVVIVQGVISGIPGNSNSLSVLTVP